MSGKSGDKTTPAGTLQPGDASETLTEMGLHDLFYSYTHAIRPETFLKTTSDLYFNLLQVSTGTSEIAPDRKDWRFKDEAWLKSPAYKRLAQAYLAMSDAIEAMVPDDLPKDEKARADFAATVLASAIAPTNSLWGNPEAMKRTIESGGTNLWTGGMALWRDMFENDGLPQQVDNSSFEVGRNLAVTPGSVVLRTEMFELIQYRPATETVKQLPVILIPPQIGRYYFTDLAPGRSFAEYAVSQGLHYFTVSWRNPSPDNRDWGLEEYLQAAIEATEAVLKITGQKKANFVGFCAGGMLTAIMVAWLAARKKSWVNTATLCVTMMNYKAEASLGAFRLPAMLSVAKAKSQVDGVLQGKDLAKVFAWLRPNDLIWKYWVNNYLMGDVPPAFDILAWNKDSTNLPAKLHEDFLHLFEENDLIEPGAFEILGEAIDLGKIRCDTFIVGALTDHLTPWKGCYETVHLVNSKSTFALSNGGHIAALVNPPGNSKAYYWVGDNIRPTADDWLEHAAKTSGSWWESWATWCAARSGNNIVAPALPGCEGLPPLCDAPGTYVREQST
ncbi:alpha/beta fold hydrolase [Emcibacter sp. SYSU 3D8]|uniref:PHA/PHB synthase family protein n=1 Tax=Emcibacter sp. SYSU 3D8 TaxID=3133969 RepID=UPI0031FF30CE